MCTVNQDTLKTLKSKVILGVGVISGLVSKNVKTRFVSAVKQLNRPNMDHTAVSAI